MIKDSVIVQQLFVISELCIKDHNLNATCQQMLS